MSIFRKASQLSSLPDIVSNAYFNSNDIVIEDDFADIIKEAADLKNKSVYASRVKNYKDSPVKEHNFTKPEPAIYSDLPGGIRRAGYGQRFQGENSPMFGSESIRSIEHDNNKYAENAFNSGLSIWEPEFDDLTTAFDASQKQHDAIFDRRTAAEKKAALHTAWEGEQLNQIRQAKVLPYRGLGVSRVANEQPIHHGKINTVDEFYGEVQDSIREMVRESNASRKAKISRQGVDPEERRSQWENKEAIQARTMQSLENQSFIAKFAEGISLDD